MAPDIIYQDFHIAITMCYAMCCFPVVVLEIWGLSGLEKCEVFFLLSVDALSGFSHCLFLDTHWAEIWYWQLPTCCWAVGCRPLKSPIFSMMWATFSFLKLSCYVLIFNIFPVIFSSIGFRYYLTWVSIFFKALYDWINSYQFCFSCWALSDVTSFFGSFF